MFAKHKAIAGILLLTAITSYAMKNKTIDTNVFDRKDGNSSDMENAHKTIIDSFNDVFNDIPDKIHDQQSIQKHSVIHTGEEETMERYMNGGETKLKKNEKTKLTSSHEDQDYQETYNFLAVKAQHDAIKESDVTKLFIQTGFFKSYNTNGWYEQATKITSKGLFGAKLNIPINSVSKVFYINMQSFPCLISLFEKINKKSIYAYHKYFSLIKESNELLKKEGYDKYKIECCLTFFNQTFMDFCKALVESKKMNDTVKKHIGFS